MAPQQKVRVFTDIPTLEVLQQIIADYKQSGYETGWTVQPDGHFRLEITAPINPLPLSGTMTSPISGRALMRG